MKTFEYTKINGAGNDFVLIDLTENPGLQLNKEEIRKICERENGIGADGLLLIGSSSELDFEMFYYNADGTSGTLCGNGARCAIKYAEVSNRLSDKSAEFLSNGAKFSGEILSDSVVKFYLNSPARLKTKFKVKAHNQLITAHYADTGSPHVVIFVDDVLSNPRNLKSRFTDLQRLPVAEIGLEIRYLPEFTPNGVNVNFIQLKDDKTYIRSYEKGVEAETLACGTGAVAAAIILSIIHKKNAPVKLITKSSAELIVNFEKENQTFVNVSLTGPVEIEHKGNYSI